MIKGFASKENTFGYLSLHQSNEMTVLEAARQSGIHVTTSAPLNLGKDIKKTDDSLRFLMNTKGILSTMVGMKQIDHAKHNIATSKVTNIQ